MADLYRVKKVIKWLIFNDVIVNETDLANQLGYKKTYLSQVLSRKVPLSDKFLDKLLSMDETISRDWVTLGKGPMFMNFQELKTLRPKNVTIAPLISRYSYETYSNNFSNGDYLKCQPKYVAVRNYSPGNYIAFDVSDQSMDDDSKRSICQGDIILVREIEKIFWGQPIQTPKVVVILHQTLGILCRELIYHDETTGTIKCQCFNKDLEFEDLELNLKDVHQMFFIKELSRQK